MQKFIEFIDQLIEFLHIVDIKCWQGVICYTYELFVLKNYFVR